MWVDGGFGTNPNSPNVPNVPPIFEEKYTYDFDSNRTAAYDGRPGGRQPFSHEYTYDGLDRLKEAKRGVWDGSSFTVADDSQRWSLDLLGNWDTMETDLNGDGVYAPSTDDLEDARSHNLVNEITQRTTTRMGSQTLSTTPTWDDAGNLRKEDRNAALEATYTHDGWNRLVKVEYKRSGGNSSTRGKYEYNALHWRTVKQADSDGSGESGDSALDQQRVMIYSANWQLLEEYVDDDVPLDTGPSDIDRHFQNFWGVQYIDDLCQRRVDTDFDGDFDDTYFHLTDVQYSTRVVIDRTGQVIERVHYDAFGKAVHQHGTDVDGDRDVDSADESLVQTIYNSGYNTIEDVGADPDAYRAEADLDRDGDVDLDDYKIIGSAQSALPFGELSTVDNNIGWDGYVFNAETRQILARNRWYDATLGRWLERDMAEFVDGMNLYGYVRSQPINQRDPSGLTSCLDKCVSGCPETYFPCNDNPGIPDQYVREHGHYSDGGICRGPSVDCLHRCQTVCGCPDDSCTPKGQVIWGTPDTEPGSSGIGLGIRIAGEDPNCCSEFGIVQFVRSTPWHGNPGDWDFDDGRVGGGSDPSPAPPYYDPPAPIRNPGGRGVIVFGDQPGSFYNIFWEFKIVVMCTAGPAAGHIYGIYTWSVGTGWGGAWSAPTSAPVPSSAIPNELPPMLQDRCCESEESEG